MQQPIVVQTILLNWITMMVLQLMHFGKILLTHKKFPDCGFVYGDWIEMNRDTFEEMQIMAKDLQWGCGHNYYTQHPFLDRQMVVVRAP
jgi:hypothetical protein